jgi:predicted ABC-type ATPase
VSLLFFWLNSVELAKERVRYRVSEGGHNIPPDVIERRYYKGLKNLFDIYLPICDNVVIMDNSDGRELAVLGKVGSDIAIFDEAIYDQIISMANGQK